MIRESVQWQNQVKVKAEALGISEEIIACALHIIHSNKNLVNAIDHRTEMDDYIYQAIIKSYTSKRRQKAEIDIESDDPEVRLHAEKDLAVLSREELTADPFYRAVLPIVAKVVAHEPILRLHADEAAAIVLELADFKRRYRATSLTEVIVTRCSAEIDNFEA